MRGRKRDREEQEARTGCVFNVVITMGKNSESQGTTQTSKLPLLGTRELGQAGNTQSVYKYTIYAISLLLTEGTLCELCLIP